MRGTSLDRLAVIHMRRDFRRLQLMGCQFAGAPGLGPLTIRHEAVVFKDGFRSRQYCLSECTQVCAASINGPAKGSASAASSP